MARSTSFRITEVARERLAGQASRLGVTATALLEQLIHEGSDQRDHPDIVFRGPTHDRRAGLAAGPDVWEVVARMQELTGSEEERIAALCAETDLSPREARAALDYAAENPEPVLARIERHHTEIARSQATARARASLLS